MRPHRRMFLVIVGWSLLVSASEAAVTPFERNLAAFDASLLEELRQAQPEAAELFAQANDARAKGDHAQAAALYRKTWQLAPRFAAAPRRLAHEELTLGHRAPALEAARAAVAIEESAFNLSALSSALASGGGDQEADARDLAEAEQLAIRAFELEPAELSVAAAAAQVALQQQNRALLENSVRQLIKLAPEEPATHLFAAFAAAFTGRLSEAEDELKVARALGLDAELYARVRKSFRDARPWPERWLWEITKVAFVWLGFLLVLFLLGEILSRATLRAAERVPTDPSGRAQGFDALLRRLYRATIAVAGGMYWLSLPIVFMVVLAVGGGAIYFFFWLGQVPVKLVAAIAIFILVTLLSMLKSLWIRVKEEDPGIRLDLTAHAPALGAVLQEVVGKIPTRPVDRVFLTPGTDLAVFERGGFLQKLRGTSERCLTLGVGVLEGLKLRPFKAILAHEYGHFSNRDTVGGGMALSVRRSLHKLALQLADQGAARPYNPAWIFVNGFHRLFLRVSQGASRLQEILADRWAASLYGASSFEAGLLHVIRQGARFHATTAATLDEVQEKKLPLANLYHFSPEKRPSEEELAQAVKQEIHREPSAYDSHPSPVKRFRLARRLKVVGEPASPDDEKDVWTLFSDRARIEHRLTELVRERLGLEAGGPDSSIEQPAASGG